MSYKKSIDTIEEKVKLLLVSQGKISVNELFPKCKINLGDFNTYFNEDECIKTCPYELKHNKCPKKFYVRSQGHIELSDELKPQYPSKP